MCLSFSYVIIGKAVWPPKFICPIFKHSSIACTPFGQVVYVSVCVLSVKEKQVRTEVFSHLWSSLTLNFVHFSSILICKHFWIHGYPSFGML